MDKQSDAKGFTILSAASIINKLLGVLYVPIVTLILGDVGNGIYNAGYTIYQLVFVITTAGIPVAISKLISEQMANSLYEASYRTLKITTTLMVTAGTLASIIIAVFARPFSDLIHYPESYLTILALSPTLLFTAVSSAFRGYFQGRSNMVPTSISQIIEQAVNSALTILFAWLMYRYGVSYAAGHGITDKTEISLTAVRFAAAGGTVGTSLGALASALYLCRTYFRHKADILAEVAQTVRDPRFRYTTRKIIRKILEYAVPITLGSAAIYVANIIDLTFMKTRLMAGGFNAVDASAMYGIFSTKYLKVLFIPVTLATALATTVVPSISQASAVNDAVLLGRRISKSIKTIMMIAVPSAIGMTILAKPIIYILFPTAPKGWELLAMGSWVLVLISLVSVQTAIIQGVGKTYIPTLHLVAGLIMKIVVNYTLIPIKSVNIKGAIVGSAVCYTFAAVMNYRSIKRLTEVRLDVKKLFNRPLSVSIIMGVVVFLVYHGILLMIGRAIRSVFLQSLIGSGIAIAAGCIVYYLLMIVAKGITAQEIRNLPKGNLILKYTAKLPGISRYLSDGKVSG
ncbi:MAG TPA: polysaccharide biosynthesis protein [Clostridia bacterium]|nr:polysaccharide biosynthesis protein [Clostridia bacterium]